MEGIQHVRQPEDWTWKTAGLSVAMTTGCSLFSYIGGFVGAWGWSLGLVWPMPLVTVLAGGVFPVCAVRLIPNKANYSCINQIVACATIALSSLAGIYTWTKL